MQNAGVTADHVQRCLEAAMNIVGKLEELNAGGQLYGTLWVCSFITSVTTSWLLWLLTSP